MKAHWLGDEWLEAKGRFQGSERVETLLGGDCTAVHGGRRDLRALSPLVDAMSGEETALDVSLGGPDLADVLAASGLEEKELADLLPRLSLRVAFLGFLPGFAYLEGLPPCLHLPRRSVPRKRIPALSLALGGGYIGIYPSPSPGGWHLIGTAKSAPFDAAAWPPTPLAAGARVRFRLC